jgi:hypothetical protein
MRKKWYKSRVMWLNSGFAALTAIEASLHLLQSEVGASAYLVIAGLVAAGNMILRTLTTTGIEK